MDATLIERSLAEQVPEADVESAASREEFLSRLAAGGVDLVISDSTVPGCQGLDAFHHARQRDARLPFIYLSGADDPSRDVRGLRALGVSDFLSKSRLGDLGPAVRQALQVRQESLAGRDPLLAGYELLVAVVRELSLSGDLDGVMAVVRRTARELTGADGATFVLREGDLCHYADEDAIGPLWKGQRFPMETCLSGWAMTHRQPAVVEDIFTDPRIPLSAYEPTFVRSVVMVPIRAIDPVGAIGTYWARARVPSRDEVQLLQALADTTAVAMENVQVRAELESRVAERTAELEAFTYAVSHDLRAPLRHLEGYAELALEAGHGEAQRHTYLERIRTAAGNMRDMVNALLDLSRTSRAELRRIPLDLARIAREVAEECARDTDRTVEFVAPPSAEATGDPVLMRAVLQNLLSNAWKFTGNADSPRVEFGVERGAGTQLTYFVRDNGAGFDPAAAGRLFGVFQRLHRQDEFPGTGVGLATVQRIVRKHGGDVWATGRPGEGATFWFSLESR